jgi:site-specific DNA recombinase
VDLFDQHSVSFVLGHPSLQHHEQHGTVDPQRAALLCPIRARGHWGTRARQDRGLETQRHSGSEAWFPLGYASINKKLVVVPDEANTVRLIFQRYLELGSVRALAEDLDRRGIRTKRRALANGQTRGGIRFGVGALAHLLKNRFYLGEVIYRGGRHTGEHQPILDRDLFEAVQAKLAGNAVERQLRLKASSALLAGRIFDDRGNRMTPTHTNKDGVRYRYYVSHALQQRRKHEAGSVSRVPAPEIDAVVLKALRHRFGGHDDGRQLPLLDDRELIERRLERVIIKSYAIEIHVARNAERLDGMRRDTAGDCETDDPPQTTITVPWSAATFAEVKGIIHSPSPRSTMSLDTRESLLSAIAKARTWIDNVIDGRVGSFSEIARREGKVERHIRLLAPLAFVSPRMISEIVDGVVARDLTVTSLAKRLAYSWAEQENER